MFSPIPARGVRRGAPMVVVAVLLALLGGWLLPARAAAQAPSRIIHVNLLQNDKWPDVAVNFNLRSLDNTPIGTLTPGQFVVEENNVPQQVGQIALGREVGTPLSVVLVIDTSGSMAGNKLKAAQAAATAFMQTIDSVDEVALLSFSDRVHPPVGFTTDRTALNAALGKLQAGGNTVLYDAMAAAATLSAGSSPGHRRAIVLLTDGQDTASKNSALIGVEAAKQAHTLVYTIGVGADTDDQVLRNLSEPTGGRYSKAAGPTDLRQIYVELAQELAGQYLLHYTSTTHVAKAYQLIHVHIVFQTEQGELLSQDINYWPPPGAILPETPVPQPTPPSVAVVPVPPGLVPALPAAAVTPRPPPAAAPDPGLQVARIIGTIAGILAALAVLFALGGIVLLRAPTAVGTRLTQIVAARLPTESGEVPATFSGRVLYPFLDVLGRRLQALTPGGYLDLVSRLLQQAGPPYRVRRAGFLGRQAGAGLVGLLLAGLLGFVVAPHDPFRITLVALVGTGVGLYLPYFSLVRRVTQRKQRVLRALPAALDFLVIMIEAGTGFDSALNELVRRWHNTLTDEFALLLIDLQIGKPRREAWRDLIARTEVPDLSNFALAMLQSEQSGSSVSTLLRVQAEQMRTRRRQRAEEAARTAPVKMLIPMALFIFPCILIVILGPAIPQVLSSLRGIGP